MLALVLFALFQIPRPDIGRVPSIRAFVPSEREPMHEVEAALANEITFTKADMYFYNTVDLNGDNTKDVLVYASGTSVCGTGGCPLFVLLKRSDRYQLITEIAPSQIPVIVSDRKSNGWKDLILWQPSSAWDPIAQIGSPAYYAELHYDGTTYPNNPTMPPATLIRNSVKGIAYISNLESHRFGVTLRK